MDLLKRKLAPITSEAWEQIDDEARRVLKLHLAGRKLVDFSGPHGWQLGAVNTGRLKQLEPVSPDKVAHAIRDVKPLIELRAALTLQTLELDYAARGADDLDLDAVIAAAERIARAEDSAIFRGFADGGITGIIEASPHAPVLVKAASDWPRAVSKAKEALRLSGVNGPYALAAGPLAYSELTSEGDDGYPLRKRLEESIAEGSLVWSPALEEGAVLLSTRGGDYELTVGQDLSVGYSNHTKQEVELFITESFTFRVLENKAAVLLRRVTS
jgi:uncharacterized linocin/CFP29 family protein